MYANKLRFLFAFLLVNAFVGFAEASSIIQENEISSSEQNALKESKNEVAIVPKANDSFAACILVMDDNHRIIGTYKGFLFLPSSMFTHHAIDLTHVFFSLQII